MNVFAIENSIRGLSNFLKNTFNIGIEGLEIRNQSKDWAMDEHLFTIDEIPENVYEHLKKKHQIDFDLYHHSLNNI